MGFLEFPWSPTFIKINGLGNGGLLKTPLGIFKNAPLSPILIQVHKNHVLS